MRRNLLPAAGLLAWAVSAAAAIDASPATNLTADQVVARNVTARGGLPSWRAVNSLTLSGQLGAGGKKEAMLPFVMTMKRPHKSRVELRFQDQTALQVFDGAQGWKIRPFLGRNEVEPFSPDEAQSAAAMTDLEGPLIEHASKGTKVELQGMDQVEGHSAYKLKLTLKNGIQRSLWVDATSFLELKIDGEPRRFDGRMRKVEIFYRDYRVEGGLTVPHLIETAVDGARQTHKMTIEKVKVNVPVDDAMFAKPQLAAAAAAPPQAR